MTTATIQTSFAAGELSPNLYARVDLEKYKVGAALLRNWFVDFRGGASTRPGTEFGMRVHVRAGNPAVRLLPFIVAELRAYAVEAGDHYFRFISDNQQVVETAVAVTGATAANPGVITAVAHGFSNLDEVVISGVVGMPRLNGRNFLVWGATANTFQLRSLDGPMVDTSTYGAYVSGGTVARVYTIYTPYSSSDLPLLKYTQSADVLTLVHPNYPPMDLTRTTPSTFVLSTSIIGPTTEPPTSLTATNTASGTNQLGYTVTAVSEDGSEESLQSNNIVIASTYLNMNYGVAPTPLQAVIILKWIAPAQRVSGYNIYKWGPTPGPGASHPAIPLTVYGYIGHSLTTDFVDTNIAPDFSRVPPQYQNPFAIGQVSGVTVTTPGTGSVNNFEPLTFVGDGAGAAGYGVIDPATGGISAVVMTNPGSNYTTCTASAAGVAGEALVCVLGPAAGTYPSCATYFQQRRVYGGPAGNPEGIVMSQTGNYRNFDTTPVSIDSDAITVSLAGREVNLIKSMVPMSLGLVVFTTGSAALLTGGAKGDAVTPSSITALPQASIGANDMPPIVVNYDVLYVQSKGSIVRDLAFSWQLQSYLGTDRSALANHLFFNQTLTEWAFAEEPFKVIWVVRQDGVLLSLTYVPEQEVFAWAHHDTQGIYESVCSIPEGDTHSVYFVVRRYIGGKFVRNIERLDTRRFANVEDAWCVDCGLTTTLTRPAATLTPSAGSGGAVFTADVAVFTTSLPGDIIRIGGGLAVITSITNPLSVVGEFSQPMTALIPGTVIPLASDDWSLDRPISTVSGLDHLIGQTVTGLADGSVVTPRTVLADGTVTLDTPATKVTLGLGFQCQLQTLYFDAAVQGTVQGKQKTIPTAIFRLDKTRGLRAGTKFTSLVELKDNFPLDTVPAPLVSDDVNVTLPGSWNLKGQVCVQQDYPLPATVLGIVQEVFLGDT